MTHKQARELAYKKLDWAFSVSKEKGIDLKAQICEEVILPLLDQYTEQKILEARIATLEELHGECRSTNGHAGWTDDQLCKKLKYLKSQLAKIKEES